MALVKKPASDPCSHGVSIMIYSKPWVFNHDIFEADRKYSKAAVY
jgi:hypothetical protein